MKFGTFVIGGLAGAVVVMLMQRNQTLSSITDGMGRMVKQRMNNMKENVIQKGIDLKFSNGSMGSSSNKSGKQSDSSKSKTDRLDQVEHLASRDPHVKHEINDVLEDNGQHRI